MNAIIFTNPFTKLPSQFSPHPQLRPLRTLVHCAAPGSQDNGTPPNPPPQAPVTPPDAVEIRFRRGSRRRQRQRQQSVAKELPRKEKSSKKWEEMTVNEKIMEMYMGEKGLLFWLNKFAYASIFVVIGGWILFRFVGPSLNLYQLDSPPLSPTNIFKGS